MLSVRCSKSSRSSDASHSSRVTNSEGRYCPRVPTAHGKQGKWPQKNPCLGKHREIGNFVKTQGILVAQVVNVLIPKVRIL